MSAHLAGSGEGANAVSMEGMADLADSNFAAEGAGASPGKQQQQQQGQ